MVAAQAPTTRKRFRRKPKTLSDGTVPEAVIQKAILSWLSDANILHWRQQSGVIHMGPYRINMGIKGLPDIVVIVPPNGHLLGLEVKSQNGALRPSQIALRARLEAAGGTYVVVRSVREAADAVAKVYGEQCKLKQLLGGGPVQRSHFGPN